jgi:uncharacterized membrane protein (UPF0127 family)
MATEKLSETHGITFDPETIRQMMIRAGIWKMRQRKKPEYFAWRERRSAYGELQQFDGSYHNWFEGRNPEMLEACLLASIDDATGKITCAEFAANEGMLFIFQQKEQPEFWMKDMKFPLDIIFINDDTVTDITKNAKPNDSPNRPRYKPTTNINYVLEVNAGDTDKKKIQVGDKVTINQ